MHKKCQLFNGTRIKYAQKEVTGKTLKCFRTYQAKYKQNVWENKVSFLFLLISTHFFLKDLKEFDEKESVMSQDKRTKAESSSTGFLSQRTHESGLL